jgi:hypothetical protein
MVNMLFSLRWAIMATVTTKTNTQTNQMMRVVIMLKKGGRRRAGRRKWASHGCGRVDNGMQCNKMIDLGLVQVPEAGHPDQF